MLSVSKLGGLAIFRSLLRGVKKEEGPPKGPCFKFSLPDSADLFRARYEKQTNPSTHFFNVCVTQIAAVHIPKKAVPEGTASLTGRNYATPGNGVL